MVHNNKYFIFSFFFIEICSCGRSSPNVFKTFDGKIINFSGKCRYQLSSFSDTSPRGTCSYSVDVVNKGTGDTYIIVNVLDMDIRFLKNKIVKVLIDYLHSKSTVINQYTLHI